MGLLRDVTRLLPLILVSSLGVISCSTTVRPPASTLSRFADSTKTATTAESVQLQVALLKQAVREDSLVDYRALHANPEMLNRAYAEIAQSSPDSHPARYPSEEERFAYWINAYNIATLYGVVRSYPLGSVRDYQPPSLYSLIPGGGFFAAQKFVFGGEKVSLLSLENEIIRERFSDPRLHFALNCASIGCPNLLGTPYQAALLNEQLEAQATAFMNSPKGVLIDDERQEIRLSAIFDWYQKDFSPTREGLLDYVANYYADPSQMQSARAAGYRLVFQDYDWALNEVPLL